MFQKSSVRIYVSVLFSTDVSFPPHCSHKLESTVYESMKKYVSTALDDWMVRNYEKYFLVDHIPEVVRAALPLIASWVSLRSGP